MQKPKPGSPANLGAGCGTYGFSELAICRIGVHVRTITHGASSALRVEVRSFAELQHAPKLSPKERGLLLRWWEYPELALNLKYSIGASASLLELTALTLYVRENGSLFSLAS